MLSNDFNTIETKGPFFFSAFVAPLTLIGAIAILITRFGWPGILIFAVIIGFLPLQTAVGKISGNIIQKVNVFKDRRIKVCTEII